MPRVIAIAWCGQIPSLAAPSIQPHSCFSRPPRRFRQRTPNPCPPSPTSPPPRASGPCLGGSRPRPPASRQSRRAFPTAPTGRAPRLQEIITEMVLLRWRHPCSLRRTRTRLSAGAASRIASATNSSYRRAPRTSASGSTACSGQAVQASRLFSASSADVRSRARRAAVCCCTAAARPRRSAARVSVTSLRRTCCRPRRQFRSICLSMLVCVLRGSARKCVPSLLASPPPHHTSRGDTWHALLTVPPVVTRGRRAPSSSMPLSTQSPSPTRCVHLPRSPTHHSPFALTFSHLLARVPPPYTLGPSRHRRRLRARTLRGGAPSGLGRCRAPRRRCTRRTRGWLDLRLRPSPHHGRALLRWRISPPLPTHLPRISPLRRPSLAFHGRGRSFPGPSMAFHDLL